MIIRARMFQIGLPRSTTSYWSMLGSGFARSGRASACCSRTPNLDIEGAQVPAAQCWCVTTEPSRMDQFAAIQAVDG